MCPSYMGCVKSQFSQEFLLCQLLQTLLLSGSLVVLWLSILTKSASSFLCVLTIIMPCLDTKVMENISPNVEEKMLFFEIIQIKTNHLNYYRELTDPCVSMDSD